MSPAARRRDRLARRRRAAQKEARKTTQHWKHQIGRDTEIVDLVPPNLKPVQHDPSIITVIFADLPLPLKVKIE